jgi:hypothetical protein
MAMIATVAMAGCSGGPVGAPAAGVTPAPFSFTGHLTVTGEVGLQGSFSDTITLRHETCRDYVQALLPATTLWVVPSPYGTTVNGHSVTYTAGVPSASPSAGYRGPGTYSGASALISVLAIDSASFVPGDRTNTTIGVAADGSGFMSFTDLVDTTTYELESGKVRWSCVSAR